MLVLIHTACVGNEYGNMYCMYMSVHSVASIVRFRNGSCRHGYSCVRVSICIYKRFELKLFGTEVDDAEI